MSWIRSDECDCPDCRPRRTGAIPLASIGDLVQAVGGKEVRAWLARLLGREPRDKAEKELERHLAEPGSAARVFARLSPPVRLAIALLVEAPAGLTSAELDFELGELASPALAARARDQLLDAGLVFTLGRRGMSPAAMRADPNSLRVLPGFARDWLAPVALTHLLASATAPSESAPPSGGQATDPGLSTAIWLAALRTVGARTTGNRLYKKDRERAEALVGGGDADGIVRALAADRLVFAERAPGSPVVPRWAAIEQWARQPAARRAADDLFRRHGASLLWQTLVDARGAWLEEIHLARRSRLVTSTIYARPAPDPRRRREAWARQRAEIEAWPEIERGERDGRTFFRLRPELAQTLEPDGPAQAAAKIFVQPDFEMILPRDAGLGAALFLARVARLVRADVVVTFKLTPESIRQAVLEGMPADKIVADLGALAAHGVPPAVERAVHDWAGNVGRCTVGSAVVVRFDDETLAARAAPALGKAAERVGPTTFVIDDTHAGDAEQLLEKAGFPPRPDGDHDPLGGDAFSEDPFGDDGDEDDAGDVASAAVDRERRSARRGDDHVAASLSLRSNGAPKQPLDTKILDELRMLRAGLPAAEPASAGPTQADGAAPPYGWQARAATSPDAIRKALLRAAQADADVAVALRDGTQEVLRLRAALPGAPAGTVRAYVHSSGTERQLSADAILSAFALYGTARAVARNQPCPCGSGRKFKRCCLPTGEAPSPVRVRVAGPPLA